MDILNELTDGSSVWIKEFIYDLSSFKLIIVLTNDPVSLKETVRLIFPDIISFDETIEEYDTDLVDSFLGIHRLEDGATIHMKTEIREIFVKTTTEPYAEKNT